MVTLGVVCCSDIVCVPVVPQLQPFAIREPSVQEVVAKSDQVTIDNRATGPGGLSSNYSRQLESDQAVTEARHEDAQPNDGPEQTEARDAARLAGKQCPIHSG